MAHISWSSWNGAARGCQKCRSCPAGKLLERWDFSNLGIFSSASLLYYIYKKLYLILV